MVLFVVAVMLVGFSICYAEDDYLVKAAKGVTSLMTQSLTADLQTPAFQIYRNGECCPRIKTAYSYQLS
jgi:hypothetical protein